MPSLKQRRIREASIHGYYCCCAISSPYTACFRWQFPKWVERHWFRKVLKYLYYEERWCDIVHQVFLHHFVVLNFVFAPQAKDLIRLLALGIWLACWWTSCLWVSVFSLVFFWSCSKVVVYCHFHNHAPINWWTVKMAHIPAGTGRIFKKSHVTHILSVDSAVADYIKDQKMKCIFTVLKNMLYAVHKKGCICKSLILLNPFTALTCKIFRLKDAWTHLQTVYFPLLSHLLSMLCVSVKILSHDSVKNKTETVQGFRFCTFIGYFQVASWQWRG